MTWSGRYVPYTWNHYNCCAICAISPVDNDPVCDWQQLMVVNTPNMANQYRTSRSDCKSTVPLANCIILYISRHITCSSNNIMRSLTQTQRHGIWNALPNKWRIIQLPHSFVNIFHLVPATYCSWSLVFVIL